MKRTISALLVSASVVLPSAASAQAMCAARSDLLTNLKGQFSEAPVAIGLTNTGGVVEVLASPEGDTWTIIVTDPQGTSCLMAAGAYWQAALKVAIGQES